MALGRPLLIFVTTFCAVTFVISILLIGLKPSLLADMPQDVFLRKMRVWSHLPALVISPFVATSYAVNRCFGLTSSPVGYSNWVTENRIPLVIMIMIITPILWQGSTFLSQSIFGQELKILKPRAVAIATLAYGYVNWRVLRMAISGSWQSL